MDTHTALNLVLILVLVALLCCQYKLFPGQTSESEQFCSPGASTLYAPYTPHERVGVHRPEPFVHPPSVYSSLPAESEKDASWKYTMPYQETCLGQCNSGSCTNGQKLTCVLTPHNQRVCSWK